MKLFIFIAICNFSLLAASAAKVTYIRILGNQITKERIIRREIQHPIPADFNVKLANEDRNRIYNLGIFSTVDVFQQDSAYTIRVTEALRIFPIPTLDYNENKGEKGWTYGGLLIFSNFRGLNERLEAGGTQGDIKSYFFEFKDPWLWGNRGFLLFAISDRYRDDDAYPIGIRLRNVQLGSGFEIRHIHKFSLLTAYNHRKLRVNDSAFDTESINFLPEYRDTEFILGYLYDTRDIYWDPTSGILAGVTWSTDIGISGVTNINKFDFSANFYHRLWWRKCDPVISIKSRIILQTEGNLPIYRQLFLGGKSFVRGYSTIPSENAAEVADKIQVQDLVYHTLEIQQTLLTKRDLNGMETGIDLVCFIDYGYGAQSPEKLKISGGLLGYGLGFRIFASSLGIIAIDLGFNPHKEGFFVHIRD